VPVGSPVVEIATQFQNGRVGSERVGAVRDREVRPERAGVDGPEEAGPVLGVHGEGQVHNLDVVVRPDVAVGIGRVYAETKEVKIILIRQAFKCQQGTGYS